MACRSTGKDQRQTPFRLNEFVLTASRTAASEPNSMPCYRDLKEGLIKGIPKVSITTSMDSAAGQEIAFLPSAVSLSHCVVTGRPAAPFQSHN